MKIHHIKICNWRSIINLDIEFQNLMMFIGQNNHGKSNILTAILFFFGYFKHDDLDFNGKSKELYIEITFNDLDDFDKNQFNKYLTAKNTIKVRKTASKDGNTEYHGFLEIPDKDWLKEDKLADYLKREIAESLPLKKYLPDSGRITKDTFIKAQETYIADNRDSITFNYKLETSFF